MASKPIEMRWFRIIVKNQEYHRITDNFHEYLMKNHEIKTSFVSPGLRPLGLTKLVFIL